MPQIKRVQWYEVDTALDGLATDVDHKIEVQREAIPLVFVPGIMGTCLRRTGTNGKGTGDDGLPTMRWNPSSATWLLKNFSGTSGSHRKKMLIGSRFDPNYLEVNDEKPLTDGFSGIMQDYVDKYLKSLKACSWGALSKIFEFPVYAVGYNWTDNNEHSGVMLKSRIGEIIKEAKRTVGACEKVILISHSMGGLVTRWASEVAGAQSSILGIVHGVQPASGAAAAYWRIKAGFEGMGPSSRVLGNSAKTVTPVLCNSPGGLQLLPNKLYKTNAGSTAWLTVTQKGAVKLALPAKRPPDPYAEIYAVRAIVQPNPKEKPSTNRYWGLVDADLLEPDDPENFGDPSDEGAPAAQTPEIDSPSPKSMGQLDELDASMITTPPFANYLTLLGIAESFHDTLGAKAHPHTFCAVGAGHETTDAIEMRVESNWVSSDPYPKRGFKGFYIDKDGNGMKAILQDGDGDGDGTVPLSSARLLNSDKKPPPGDTTLDVEHQPAFQDGSLQAFVLQAIAALCKIRYQEKRGAGG
jgi:hypothetical protein